MTEHGAKPRRHRQGSASGTAPQYQSIADALQQMHGPIPPPAEIARLYGVTLTTAQFVHRALHTRQCAASRRGAGSLTVPADTGQQPLWRRVANDLTARILSGVLWERIPTRLHLATQYGVSAPTINKAVNILIGEGLLLPGGRVSPPLCRPGTHEPPGQNQT